MVGLLEEATLDRYKFVFDRAICREHPQHQTTFYTRSLIPRTVDKRRVGRPRLSWTHDTMKVAWNLSQGYPFNFQDREMRLTLKEMAQNRIPPFD